MWQIEQWFRTTREVTYPTPLKPRTEGALLFHAHHAGEKPKSAKELSHPWWPPVGSWRHWYSVDQQMAETGIKVHKNVTGQNTELIDEGYLERVERPGKRSFSYVRSPHMQAAREIAARDTAAAGGLENLDDDALVAIYERATSEGLTLADYIAARYAQHTASDEDRKRKGDPRVALRLLVEMICQKHGVGPLAEVIPLHLAPEPEPEDDDEQVDVDPALVANLRAQIMGGQG